ncbi:MAG: hypothetical protein ACRDJE_04660, partial [Dehalococcoidia bacterium]
MPRRSPARALRTHRRFVLVLTSTVLVLVFAAVIAPAPVAASWALVHGLLTPSHSITEEPPAPVSARSESELPASDDARNVVRPCAVPDGTDTPSSTGCE